MYTIKSLPEFDAWFDSLKDPTTRARLIRRLEKAERGLLGDVEPVGEGVNEMREFFGPGWRMYYIEQGDVLIVMLGGGSKVTQTRDIKRAKKLARTLRYDEKT
ncbi:type II toxin-antitoxin system RelE/ParE family toxin [Neopusillimonas aromaticivorans]|jgi:putative addiction module killer protein|uniref:type II toxin-antitoxin system RelE/ParE family toxin n=1 Tax=Neopusillimonas aromaticivorans TaxID=2979868 RepID=UPI0025948A3A|nr:type II toxin-antitoxin system RelE/ParE family toxin [Neopusillimonas aromaticivorans]NLZ11897.1 type II toxin-antitoxin system RelE/ParE family toxin [Alcaligenaceae bacterium]WJJ94449.1 type II toxin-antitoxin system RelE/ParE family toxin [Neopusillimonas aromaticivorans]